ncbi:MAG: hypothetical protein Q8Q92_04735 [bacterium]|nr:hypothetical protein [bacterium]
MGRYRCSEHGIEYNGVCPACRDEKAEEDRQSIIEGLSELAETRAEQAEEVKQSLEDVAYKQANPGDYQCPECLFITLKRGASRCPMCRSSIPREYWERVAEQERIQAERAAKIQAEQRAAREAGLEAFKKAAQKATREKLEVKRRNDEVEVVLMLFVMLVLVSIMILSPVPPAVREIIETIMRWIN